MQVDPNLNPKTLGKLEDDVPALYKRLRYPFQMSKSALFAVGSPHTWPSVLAALAWLTELLQYQEKTVRPCFPVQHGHVLLPCTCSIPHHICSPCGCPAEVSRDLYCLQLIK